MVPWLSVLWASDLIPVRLGSFFSTLVKMFTLRGNAAWELKVQIWESKCLVLESWLGLLEVLDSTSHWPVPQFAHLCKGHNGLIIIIMGSKFWWGLHGTVHKPLHAAPDQGVCSESGLEQGVVTGGFMCSVGFCLTAGESLGLQTPKKVMKISGKAGGLKRSSWDSRTSARS